MNEDRRAADETSLGGRFFAAARVLVTTKVEAAQREARTDFQRVVAGLFLAGFALVFLLIAGMVFQAAAVVFIQAQFGINLVKSLLIVAGTDIVVALVLAWVARAKLTPPMMVETRAMVKRATEAIRGS